MNSIHLTRKLISYSLFLPLIFLSSAFNISGQDCNISIYDAYPELPCAQDGTYTLVIKGLNENMENDTLEVFVDGVFYDEYPQMGEGFSLILSGIAGNNNTNEITICLLSDPNCCVTATVDSPNCSCNLFGIEIEPSDCIGNTYDLFVNADHSMNANDLFSIVIPGIYNQTHEFSELPIVLGGIESSGNPIEQLTFCVPAANDCCLNSSYEPPFCGIGDCGLELLEIEFGECEGDTYGMWISFEAISPTQEIFDLWINDEYFGFFELDALPLYVEEIIPSNGGIDWIEVCINDNENCCTSMEYEQPECFGDCFIGELIIEPSDCEAGEFYFDITFEYEGTSDFFEIFLNNSYYTTIAYDLLPVSIGPFDSNDPISYNFLIHDLLDNSCMSILEFGEYNCGDECEIIDLEIITGECEGDTYSVMISFEVINPSQDQFDLWINGTMVGFYSLNDLPLTVAGIEPLPGGVDWLEVCINDNPNCCDEEEYLQPDCLGGDCLIADIIAEPTECEGDLFYFEITFEYVNTSDEFNVLGNGFDYGEFGYDDLPILVGPFEGSDPTFYEFVITDGEDQNCSSFIEFGEYMCDEDCVIDDLSVDPEDCNGDGTYNMFINFNVINPGNSYFDYYVNEDIQGFALLNSLPLYIENIVPRNDTDYDIIEVCINDVEDCCLEFEYLQPECLTTGMEEWDEEISVQIFQHNLKINLSHVQDFQCQILDLSGKLVWTSSKSQSSFATFNLSSLKDGAFLIRVIGNRQIFSRKMVLIK